MANILVALVRISSEFKPDEGRIFSSRLLNNILKILPSIRDTARSFLNAIDIKEARDGNMAGLWADPDKFPDVQDAKDVSLTAIKRRVPTDLVVYLDLRKRPGRRTEGYPKDC